MHQRNASAGRAPAGSGEAELLSVQRSPAFHVRGRPPPAPPLARRSVKPSGAWWAFPASRTAAGTRWCSKWQACPRPPPAMHAGLLCAGCTLASAVPAYWPRPTRGPIWLEFPRETPCVCHLPEPTWILLPMRGPCPVMEVTPHTRAQVGSPTHPHLQIGFAHGCNRQQKPKTVTARERSEWGQVRKLTKSLQQKCKAPKGGHGGGEGARFRESPTWTCGAGSASPKNRGMRELP